MTEGGAIQVADRIHSVEGNALMLGGQKAGTPVGRSRRRDTANIGDGDISREVIALAAQGVTEPGTSRRKALKYEAAIHRDAGGAVGIGTRCHRVYEGHIVDPARKMRQHTGDVFARLPAGLKVPGAAHQVAVGTLKSDIFVSTRQCLATALFELGLVIESVEVGDATGAEDLDHAFGLGREVGLPAGTAQEIGTRDSAEAAKKAPAMVAVVVSRHRETRWR